MMQLIYYPKCSTCQKAIKHLKNKGKNVELRNIVEQTPTQKEMLTFIQTYNKGIKPFFNTSGKMYRELSLKDKVSAMSEEEAALLLSQNGMLIKRPILLIEDQIIIGYNKEVYENL
jgi:transcriptional regulator, Spx/MgsR family